MNNLLMRFYINSRAISANLYTYKPMYTGTAYMHLDIGR